MKIKKVVASILIFSSSCIFFINVKAQELRKLEPLDKGDFKCLQSIQCIQNSSTLKAKGWKFIFDRTVEKFPQELTARMKGENISFFAIYDKKGNLIKSKYKRTDVPLPPSFLVYLTQQKYKGWQIAATEFTMENFDTSLVTYRVLLKREKSKLTKEYDQEFVNKIDRKFKSIAEH